MKRNTVDVNCEKINPKIKENGWSNASFSRLVGKYPSWYGEVKRGNNLPSPEEAAKMCTLLGVAPEGILVEPADIELVRGLLETGGKEAPAAKGKGYDDKITRLYTQLPKLSDRQREIILGIVDEMLKNGEA